MKKLLSIIAVLGLAISLQAQPFQSPSFLTVPAVYVTNILQITNVSLNNLYGTNIAGTAFTNITSTGAQVLTVVNSNYSTLNFCADVPLWADRNGRWYGTYTNADSSIAGTDTPMILSISLVGGSGANSAVTFTFAPVYDNQPLPSGLIGRHSTVAAEQWAVAVTATTTTAITTGIPVPAYRWPGARALRLLRIVNADTDASSQVIVYDCSLNGYRP